MKKIFTTSVFVILFVWGISAQVTITYQSQAIQNGDSHHFYICQSVNEGPSGPNQIWDFSGLKKQSELTSKMLNPAETAGGQYITEATSVIREYGNDFYFKVSDQYVEEYGFASCGGVFKYDKPLIKLKFPFNYGNVQQGSFHGINVNNPSVQLNGVYQVEADAYGKLILPGNVTVNDVIRLKSTRSDETGNTSSTTTTYRWYSNDVRYPLLTIIKTENAGTSNSILAAYYPDITYIKSASAKTQVVADKNASLSVYPVPFDKELNIAYTIQNPSNISIELTDNSGKVFRSVVKYQEEGSYIETFTNDVDELAQGVYFIKIIINGKVTTKKVVKI